LCPLGTALDVNGCTVCVEDCPLVDLCPLGTALDVNGCTVCVEAPQPPVLSRVTPCEACRGGGMLYQDNICRWECDDALDRAGTRCYKPGNECPLPIDCVSCRIVGWSWQANECRESCKNWSGVPCYYPGSQEGCPLILHR
jgi:hypothetical protein